MLIIIEIKQIFVILSWILINCQKWHWSHPTRFSSRRTSYQIWSMRQWAKEKRGEQQEDLRKPDISSKVEMPLSAKSSSGFLISLDSSRTFLAFDILLVFGIQETGAWFIVTMIRRRRTHSPSICPSNSNKCLFVLALAVCSPTVAG